MTDLVALGRLTFRDFLRLDRRTLRAIVADPECRPDLGRAAADQPDILYRLRLAGLSPALSADADDAAGARDRLVRRCAFELLREKAPALWDVLPCFDWDTGVVTRRYQPWKTRFLVAGEPAASCLAAFRRTAGIWCVEPIPTLRAYLERKAETLRVKRFRTLDADLGSIPLPDGAADLAIVGPGLGAEPETALAELARVCRATLLLDFRPGGRVPDPGWLERHGFARERVRVAGVGRDGWYRGPDALTPAPASK